MLFVTIIPKIPPILLLKVFNFVFYAYPKTPLGDRHVRDARRICPARQLAFQKQELTPLNRSHRLLRILCFQHLC